MTALPFKRPKLTWRRLLLGSLGLGAVAGVVWLGRAVALPGAEAAPPAPAPAAAEAPPPPAPAEPSDYTKRVVAYVYGNTAITREQLGEYLIARFGPDKVLNLVNKLIIERTCAERGITVTDAEVDLALADDVAALKVNRREFVEKILKEYRKSLYEWKEDVLRPKLLMTKLLRSEVRVTEEDVRHAFESVYGEKLYCQAILWPKNKYDDANKMYPTIRDNPEEFERQARLQNSGLAASHGMMEPFGRYGLDDDLIERETFKLKEGEITKLLRSPSRAEDGQDYSWVVLKLVRRLPANPTKKLEDVRVALEKEILDHKVRALIPEEMVKMHKAADPKIVLKAVLPEDENPDLPRGTAPAADGVPVARQPVAYIYGGSAVTREQFGEYLIARYGAERLDLMVNKIIVEKECAAKGVSVSEAEIDAELAKHIAVAKAESKKDFIQNVLRSNRTTLYGYREDVLRPKLLLAKLARDSVKVEPDDLGKAFAAYHGEKARCQIIMWPRTPRDHEIAIKQYDVIRKGPEEFERAAKMQASPRLAADAGRIEPFGRHSTGNDNLEREVFALRVGDITPIVETPEGYVVARLVEKIPADAKADLEAERPRLEAEILDKKAQMRIPAEFAKLREAAAPNVILRSMLREDDWIRDVKQEIGGKGADAPRAAAKN